MGGEAVGVGKKSASEAEKESRSGLGGGPSREAEMLINSTTFDPRHSLRYYKL